MAERSIFLVVLVLAVLLALALFFRWLDQRLAARQRQLLLDFAQRFPGVCPICSFRRYGVAHGFERDDSLEVPHPCPERDPALRERLLAELRSGKAVRHG